MIDVPAPVWRIDPYIRVEVGDGAVHFIPNPKSDRHWQMRYNQKLDQLLVAVMILESFDYLLCDEISQTEAIRRLKILRKARNNPPNAEPSGPAGESVRAQEAANMPADPTYIEDKSCEGYRVDPSHGTTACLPNAEPTGPGASNV